MTVEADIVHENGDYWVSRERRGNVKAYAVNLNRFSHAVEIARFSQSPDGLSCAIAYANYKAKHA